MLERGVYTFDLCQHDKFEPESIEVEIGGTTAIRPKQVSFKAKDQAE